jgi:hypothetical protein
MLRFIMEHDFIGRINSGRHKFFLAITGGGTSFIGDYISHGGASKVLIGAYVPYAQTEFDDFIRGKVERYASEEGARKLAVASFNRCLKNGVPVKDALGVGASCSIASTSPERDGRKHRFYVASHSYDGTYVTEMVLNQMRNRSQEEHMAVNMIYNTLVSATLKEPAPYGAAIVEKDGEIYQTKGYTATPDLADFYNGASWIEAMPNFIRNDGPLVIYPGSWNPIHEGHRNIMDMAQYILNEGKPILELSLDNTDKGRMDYIDLQFRLKQLDPYDYILTRAPFFRSKVELLTSLYPNKKLIFVVGEDTWSRIWDENYCIDNSISKEADFFARFGVRFLVLARGGRPFQKQLYPPISEFFRIEHPRAENFNDKHSSSAIRKQQTT